MNSPPTPDRIANRVFILRTIFFVCVVLNLYIYSLSANGPYIVDDFPNLLENKTLLIRDLSWDSLKAVALSSPASRYHRPLSMLTFAANYSLAGNTDPYPVKMTNIFLHVITGTGIYLLTLTLLTVATPRRDGHERLRVESIALLTAFLWLFHPLFVSTVLYAIQRMAMLSTLFVIIGGLYYCRLRKDNLERNRNLVFGSGVIILITLAAFLSKENGALLPGFLLLIEIFFFNFQFHPKTSRLGKTVLISTLVLPACFIIGYLAVFYLRSTDGYAGHYFYTVHERLLSQFRVLWHYIGWLTFTSPEPMAVYHDDFTASKSLFSPITTFTSLLGLIAVPAALVKFFHVRHIGVFCILWFLWGQIMESTVLPLSLMFEHRNYLPGYGILLGLSILITGFAASNKNNRLLKGLIFLVVFTLPVYLFYERVRAWDNVRSFTLALLNNNPQSTNVYILAAKYLEKADNFAEAINAIHIADQLKSGGNTPIFIETGMRCKMRPDMEFDPEFRNRLMDINLGETAFSEQMHLVRAAEACAESPKNYPYLINLYNKIIEGGNSKLAAIAYYGMGLVYAKTGDYAATIKAWENAVNTHKVARQLMPHLEKLKEEYEKNRTLPQK